MNPIECLHPVDAVYIERPAPGVGFYLHCVTCGFGLSAHKALKLACDHVHASKVPVAGVVEDADFEVVEPVANAAIGYQS